MQWARKLGHVRDYQTIRDASVLLQQIDRLKSTSEITGVAVQVRGPSCGPQSVRVRCDTSHAYAHVVGPHVPLQADKHG
jgi:hypothetical protein